eukprot:GAHX01002785.1.p1 GENE.GAHX01002785.1~~GAHX01002785.1.p1  ORF type:complete len:180 (+),score=33.64 GAHX01002785.1:25-540(+)
MGICKLSIQVGLIKNLELIESSDKLYRLQVSFDEESNVQIVSGLGLKYKTEDLLGKKFIFIRNIKPSKLLGNASNGMILCAKGREPNTGEFETISVSDEIPEGTRVQFKDFDLIEKFTKLRGSKLTDELAKLKIDEDGFIYLETNDSKAFVLVDEQETLIKTTSMTNCDIS